MRSLHLTLVAFCHILLASFVLYSSLSHAWPIDQDKFSPDAQLSPESLPLIPSNVHVPGLDETIHVPPQLVPRVIQEDDLAFKQPELKLTARSDEHILPDQVIYAQPNPLATEPLEQIIKIIPGPEVPELPAFQAPGSSVEAPGRPGDAQPAAIGQQGPDLVLQTALAVEPHSGAVIPVSKESPVPVVPAAAAPVAGDELANVQGKSDAKEVQSPKVEADQSATAPVAPIEPASAAPIAPVAPIDPVAPVAAAAPVVPEAPVAPAAVVAAPVVPKTAVASAPVPELPQPQVPLVAPASAPAPLPQTELVKPFEGQVERTSGPVSQVVGKIDTPLKKAEAPSPVATVAELVVLSPQARTIMAGVIPAMQESIMPAPQAEQKVQH